MRKNQIVWTEVGVFNHSANVCPPGKPYKGQMRRGKVFPVSKAQALAFVRMGCLLGELNFEDVRVVEMLLNKHGLFGDYRYSGMGMVKLVNACDLEKALRLEYKFN